MFLYTRTHARMHTKKTLFRQLLPLRLPAIHESGFPFKTMLKTVKKWRPKKEEGRERAHRVINSFECSWVPRFLQDSVGTTTLFHNFMILPCNHALYPRNSQRVNCKVRPVSSVASGTWYNANRFPYVVPGCTPQPQAPIPRENSASQEMLTF